VGSKQLVGLVATTEAKAGGLITCNPGLIHFELAKIGVADHLVFAQFGGGAAQYDLAGLQDIGAVGDRERHIGVLWANTKSKVYHFACTRNYGKTKQGAHMCQKDSDSAGFRAAKNEKP
jgi:hypothetical protein